MAKLVFLKRTAKEVEVFGGEVYFDIDGKNIGTLKSENIEVPISEGAHTIKMYKSHTYDSFIGIAESTITLAEDEELMVKYSAPMMVNQPGNMVISAYEPEKAETVQAERENTMKRDFVAEQTRKQEAEEKYKKGIWTVVIVMIIIGIIWAISDAIIMSSY